MKTTTKKMMALAAITSAVLLTGCQKDLYDPNYVDSKDAPISGIPSDFNWSTISSVNLTVNVDDQFLGQYNYVVEVFDQNPIIDSSAKLLTKGLAKQGQAFITTFAIPQALKTLYIRQTAPDGLKIVRSYDLSSSTLVCDFRATATKSVATKSVVTRSSIAGTTFPTPSDAIEINSSSKNIDLKADKSYVIKKGTVYDGDIKFSGNSNFKTYLYIEGEWQLGSGFKMEDGLVVVVQNGGIITFSKAVTFSLVKTANLWIMQGGIFNPSQTAKVNIYGTNSSSVNNQGTIYASDIKIDASATLNNSGKISSTGLLTASNSGNTINNDGRLIVDAFKSTDNPTLNNNCYIKVNNNTECGQLICNLNNNTYFCTKTITTDSGIAQIKMSAYSILEVTENAYFKSENKIIGTNTGSGYAIAKFKKLKADWHGVEISGNVEFECSDYTQNDQYNNYCTINSPAHYVAYGSPTVAIASDPDGCTGPGSTPKTETKTDPTYPLDVNLGTTYTYAMEDLWPNYGDYDMNDIVVAINPKYTLSSADYVQSMTFVTTLKAIGASKSLAAAIQLDNVSDENVADVTYSVKSTDGSVFTIGDNKVELFNTSENAKAVIPLFDNAHQFLGNSGITNTAIGGTTIPEKSVTVTVIFVTNKVKPADVSDIKTGLNFFIVTDKQKTNRTEVHLRGFNATSHANKSLFGTGVDDSNTGLTFKSNSNLVWGMVIPDDFSYPIESTSILTAYPDFKPWAVSGGTTNTDWYNSSKANSQYIYK